MVKKCPVSATWAVSEENRRGAPSFNRIVPLQSPGRIAFGADHGPNQVNGNFQQTERLKLLDDQFAIELDEGF